MSRRVVVTGGAGFIGSSLALRIKQAHPGWTVVALDNLRRRGSELCLPRLRAGGVTFVHGDVRIADDLRAIDDCELIVECSAEPSVLAGLAGSPAYVIDTNLMGAIRCLELARRTGAAMVFLSTSRVYPIDALARIGARETDTRFELEVGDSPPPGLSEHGVAEGFGLDGARSLYGATKLCAETLIHEYVAAYGLRAVIDRCGVIAGPWQMGKVDQGVVMHWVASHVFDRPLAYIGYGGTGKQVRDVLHIDDLAALIDAQIARIDDARGEVYNVGGGRACSVSLRELTELCVHATGTRVAIRAEPQPRPADIPLYLTDARKVSAAFEWRPARSREQIVEDIARWIADHRDAIEGAT